MNDVDWESARPGKLFDAEWFLQEGDHAFMQVAGQLTANPVSFRVPAVGFSSSSSSSSQAAYVWAFRVESCEPLTVRFYRNTARDLQQPLQLRSVAERLCNVSGMRLVLAPSMPGEVLSALSREQYEELQESLSLC
jgi:hypothetical protein